MFRIENDSKGANTARTVRFTEKLFEQLNHLAAQNNISFNSLVIQCCKYALDNYDGTASDIDNIHLK
ncbi:MAG: hypothetical protein HFE65_11020 [Clostridiales bacterium]|jgi:predicted HicB family RNase H-like nuclease|nr:hypothetical protein [Clostridiales bacterium]